MGNCLTSFFAGFAIFSILGAIAFKTMNSVSKMMDFLFKNDELNAKTLGNMALTQGVTVEDIVADGIGLAFVVYPEGLSTLPGAPFFSACFFAMLFFLGASPNGRCFLKK